MPKQPHKLPGAQGQDVAEGARENHVIIHRGAPTPAGCPRETWHGLCTPTAALHPPDNSVGTEPGSATEQEWGWSRGGCSFSERISFCRMLLGLAGPTGGHPLAAGARASGLRGNTEHATVLGCWCPCTSGLGCPLCQAGHALIRAPG